MFKNQLWCLFPFFVSSSLLVIMDRHNWMQLFSLFRDNFLLLGLTSHLIRFQKPPFSLVHNLFPNSSEKWSEASSFTPNERLVFQSDSASSFFSRSIILEFLKNNSYIHIIFEVIFASVMKKSLNFWILFIIFQTHNQIYWIFLPPHTPLNIDWILKYQKRDTVLKTVYKWITENALWQKHLLLLLFLSYWNTIDCSPICILMNIPDWQLSKIKFGRKR